MTRELTMETVVEGIDAAAQHAYIPWLSTIRGADDPTGGRFHFPRTEAVLDAAIELLDNEIVALRERGFTQVTDLNPLRPQPSRPTGRFRRFITAIDKAAQEDRFK